MRKSDGTLNGGFVWADVPVGGAGFATGPSIHATSGRQFIGTDTCGAYIRDQTDDHWTPLFTTSTLASADYIPRNGGGSVHRGTFAPSDKSRLYSHFNNYWFRIDIDPAKAITAPGAITCTRWPTAMGTKRIDSGAGFNRAITCHPAVHPTDKNIVLLPTSNDGVYYSTDGLATVNSITIPACTSCSAVTADNFVTDAEVGRAQYIVWIDQGNVLYCYIYVQGIGLHRSTAGIAGPYTLITGSPLGAMALQGEADGTMWVVADERTNCLTNTFFDTNTTGWTAGNSATLSLATGSGFSRLKILNGAASAGYAYQAFTTVVGYTYNFYARVYSDGTAVDGIVNIGTAAGASDITTLAISGTAGGHQLFATFVATGTTTYISLAVNSSTSGAYALFDEPLVASVGVYQLARGGSSFTPKGVGITTAGINFPQQIAIDPFDNQGILIWRGSPGAYSTNRGTSWNQTVFTIVAGGECLWRPRTAPQMGGIAFDPTTQNRILCGEGYGAVVWTSYRASSTTVLDYSKGMEQKIDLYYHNNPATGQNTVGAEDLSTTVLASLTKYINLPDPGTAESTGHQYCSQVDSAIDNPAYMVGSFEFGSGGYSAQSGAKDTWHSMAAAYPSTPNSYAKTGVGLNGSCAVSNAGNIVIAPSSDAYASYTKDSGATLNPVVLGGSTDYCTNHAYFIHPRIILSADKTRPGVFAMVVNTTLPGTSIYTNTLGGLWLTTDGGDNWTQKFQGIIGFPGLNITQVTNLHEDGRQFYQCKLEYVPGFSQELLYTTFDGSVPPTGIDNKLRWSQDDGATWTAVGPSSGNIVRQVRHFAFGKALIGQTRPAVYFWGDVGGVTGNWVTYDWFVTFYKVSDEYPNGYIADNGNAVGADLSVFGRMFCVITGKGSVYSAYRDVAHGT